MEVSPVMMSLVGELPHLLKKVDGATCCRQKRGLGIRRSMALAPGC